MVQIFLLWSDNDYELVIRAYKEVEFTLEDSFGRKERVSMKDIERSQTAIAAQQRLALHCNYPQ